MKEQHEQNVGTVERWVRVVGGGLAVLVGLALLFASPTSVLWGVAYVAVALLGLDFFVTGVTGYCPLYQRLGRSTVYDDRYSI